VGTLHCIVTMEDDSRIDYKFSPESGWGRRDCGDQAAAKIGVLDVPPEVLSRFSADVK
jgi:hypothetical protein